jgi:hypothetical protein
MAQSLAIPPKEAKITRLQSRTGKGMKKFLVWSFQFSAGFNHGDTEGLAKSWTAKSFLGEFIVAASL